MPWADVDRLHAGRRAQDPAHRLALELDGLLAPAPLARLLGGAVPVNPVDGKTPFAYGTAGPWLGVQSTLRPSQEFWTCIPGTPRTTYKDLSYPLTAKAGGASGEAGDSDSDGDEAAETKSGNATDNDVK